MTVVCVDTNWFVLRGLKKKVQKILPEAMDYLFHAFNDSFLSLDTYCGLRLLACDGSNIPIANNPNDKTTYRRHNSLERKEKGYNQLRLNALYDLKKEFM